MQCTSFHQAVALAANCTIAADEAVAALEEFNLAITRKPEFLLACMRLMIEDPRLSPEMIRERIEEIFPLETIQRTLGTNKRRLHL